MEEENEEQRRSGEAEAVEKIMWSEDRGRGDTEVVSRGSIKMWSENRRRGKTEVVSRGSTRMWSENRGTGNTEVVSMGSIKMWRSWTVRVASRYLGCGAEPSSISNYASSRSPLNFDCYFYSKTSQPSKQHVKQVINKRVS